MIASPRLDQVHTAARDNLYRYVNLTTEWHDRATAAGANPLGVLPVALNVHMKALTDHDSAVALLAVALIELDRLRREADFAIAWPAE